MTAEHSDAFQAQLTRVRESGILGRSHGLARLFEYLAQAERSGQGLREADVALDVFGRGATLSSDASVRVYVHRLRRKLDDFYAGPGAGETYRLLVPLGEYRLDVAAVTLTAMPPGAAPRRRWLWRAILAGSLLIAVNLAGWWAISRLTAPERGLAALAATPLWAGIGRERPVLLVVGDYYIFGDTDGAHEPKRMVRAFEINSPTDLDAWLMDNPQFQGRYIDLDTYYTPVGATLALREIMPLVRQAAGGPDRIRLTTASHLTPEMLKSNDVVYVGYLSSLRVLQDSVFERSRYAIGSTYDELVERKTGKSYVSGAGAVSGDRVNRDYGYLAAFTGPSGARVVIIAGNRDIGVMQIAEMATDRAAMASIQRKTGTPFEALYEVEGVGRTNINATRVEASP